MKKLLKEGFVGFQSNYSFISSAIIYYTRQEIKTPPISHVFMVLDENNLTESRADLGGTIKVGMKEIIDGAINHDNFYCFRLLHLYGFPNCHINIKKTLATTIKKYPQLINGWGLIFFNCD